MNRQNQPFTLIAVTPKDTALFFDHEGKARETTLQNDTKGRIYFEHAGVMQYLPLEFQPQLIVKN